MGGQTSEAVAQPSGNPAQRSGPHAPPIEALRGPRANRPARTMPDAEATQPRTWSGFGNLAPEVQSNLLESGGTILSSPSYTPNVRANDPTGDLTNEGQYSVTVAAWNRFVVVSWIDTKGADAPGSAPPSTFAGYAYSCDWGATFTDGGALPRPVADEQVYRPAVARSESGEFYLAAAFATGLAGTTTFGVGFWKGTFDTTACTFSWGPRQTVPGMAVAGDDYDVPSIAVDPANSRIWVAACHIPGGDPNWYIIATASDDGGTTWKPVQTLSQTTGFPASYYPYASDIAVGPDGEAHVVWGDTAYWFWCDYSSYGVSHIVHSRSTNGGTSWSAPTMAAPYFTTYFSDGPLNPFGYHRPIPRVAVDRTTGVNRGRVYATWAAGTYWDPPAPGTGNTVAEVEPNDVPADALTLVPGDDATGIGENNTVLDWWRIDLVAGQVLLVRLEPDGFVCGSANSSYYFRIGLRTDPLDPSTAPLDTLLSASATFTPFHQIAFTCKQTGTYYLRAALSTATSATNVPYILRTRLITWGAGPGSGRDESDILFASSPDGVTPWTAPERISDEAPIGYCETDPDVAVDASGRVHVIWHDFRETEVEPRLTLQGEIADLFMRTSTSGGASFAPAERISAVSGLFGLTARTNFIYSMFGNDLVADGDHLMLGWSDMRHPDRLTTHSNAYTQFVDKEVPAVAISWPAGSPNWTNVSPSIGWQGTDRRNGTAGNEYRWDLFNMPGHTLHSTSGFSTATGETFSPAPGHYQVEVYARDAAGNANPTPATGSFILDQVAPAVTITTGPANGAVVGSADVTFSWSATDNWSGQYPDNFGFSYEIDDARSPYPPTGTGVGPTTVNLTSLAAGSHTFKVWARDHAGNESDPVTRTFTVDVSAPETVILSGPADGSTITTGSPTFTFTGSDDQTAVGQLEYAIEQDGGGFGEYSTATSATPTLGEGAHSFAVRARDQAGNEDASPATTSFTVHYAPVVTFTSGPTEGGYSGGTVTFTWSATLSSLATSVTYETSVDGGSFVSQGTSTTLALNGLAAGGHTLTVRATDDGGFEGTATRTWTVDATAPTVVVDAPTEGQHLGSSTVAASWTGNDTGGSGGVQFSWRLDGGAWSGYDAATSANIPDVAPGTHTLELRAVDAVGNVSGGTTTCNFDVTGLVSWWRGEGTFDDGWGSNHGTPIGGVTFVPAAYYPGGVAGQAFQFDGFSYITAGPNPNLLPGTGSFSIEAWIRREPGTETFLPEIIVTQRDRQTGAGLFGSRYALELDLDGYVVFRVKANSTTTGSGQFLNSFFVPHDGVWHHVVGVRQVESNSLFLYVDGSLVNVTPLTTQSSGNLQDQSTPDPLVIGAVLNSFGVPNSQWGGQQFSGEIDEVAYTNRALSPTEIAAIYGARGRSCTGGGIGATRHFTVDLTAPETQIVSAPAEGSSSNLPSVTIEVSGSDDLSPAGNLEYSHAVDGGDYSAYSTSTQIQVTGLDDGPHSFSVVARDLAGNVDASAATRSWTTDVIPPVVTFETGPAEGGTSGPSATFTWSAVLSPAATNVTYETSLDGATYVFQGGSLTLALSLLSEGAHTLVVRATDNLGSQGTATRSWTVDATAPVLTITGTPEEGLFTASATASFAWSATDAGGGVEYSWKLDAGPFSPYGVATSAEIGPLPPGEHTFEVKARDAVGNETQAACVFGTSQMSSWWKGEGDATDSWGSNQGSTPAGASYVAGPSGGQAFSLANQHVFVPHNANLDPGVGSFTIEAWIRTTAVAGTIVSKTEGSGSIQPASFSQYRLLLNSGRAAIGMTDDALSQFISVYTSTSPQVNDNQWHHLVGGRDVATGRAFLYVDGVSVISAPLTANMDGPIGDVDGEPDPLFIGARPGPGNTASAFFNGDVDEVLFHGRALAPAEIAAVYAAGGRAVCAAGRTQTRRWTVDTTAPTVQITSAPPAFTNATSATFQYEATDDLSPVETQRFQWSLDGATFSTPSVVRSAVFSVVAPGPHSFQVRAIDPAGNAGSAVTHNWTVDVLEPETQITAGPEDGSTVTTSSVTFDFTGTDNASATPDLQYAHSFEGGTWTSFSPATSATFNGLADGVYDFRVVAQDQAGWVDQSPAMRTWTVHAVAPVVTLDTAPAEGAYTGPSVSFAWSSVLSPVATGVTYATQLDGASFVDRGTATTLDLSGLGGGSHTLTVQATDNASLVGAVTRSWTVDTVRPVVAITAGPAEGGYSNSSVTFDWTVTDDGIGGGTTFWRLDAGAWTDIPVQPTVGAPIWADDFAYPDGWLVPNGGWVYLSGHAKNDLQVVSGRAIGGVTVGGRSDAHTFTPRGASAKTYYALDFRVTSVNFGGDFNNGNLSLLAHFGSAHAGKLFLDSGASLTKFRLGVSVDASVPDATWPSDLEPGQDYRVVVAYDAAAGSAELSVGPLDDWTPATLTVTGGTTGIQVGSIVLSEQLLGENPGTAYQIDRLRIAADFATAFDAPPATYSAVLPVLGDGPHVFEVKAQDLAGNESEPLARSWTVDVVAPVTQIVSGPAEGGTEILSTATFEVSGTDNTAPVASLEYSHSLDGGAATAFSSTTTVVLPGLDDGAHTFSVAARDPAGNVDATPETRTWTVHSQEPVVTLDVAPAEGSYTGTTVPFNWSSVLSPAATGVTYATKLDAEAFVERGASTSFEFTGLAGGSHTVVVQATDNAGLVGTATRTWSVDTDAPVVVITAGPPVDGFLSSQDATIRWSALDAGVGGASSSWQLDGLGWVSAGGSPGPGGTVLLAEPFDYTDGPLVPRGGWATHSGAGTPAQDLQVIGGRVVGDMSSFPDDDRTFPEQGPTAKTYYALDVRIPAIVGTPATTYFAHMKDAGVLFAGRLFVTPGTTTFRFGVSANSTVPGAVWMSDLDYDRNYRVVVAYDAANGSADLWVNPADESSPKVTATDGFPGNLMSAFALRQANPGTGTLWRFSVDDVGVGTTFAAAVYRTPQQSEVALTDLPIGGHVFAVRAVDAVGNLSTVVGRTWTVDLAAPETQIVSGPGATETTTAASFLFGGTDDFSMAPALEYSYTLDNDPATAFSAAPVADLTVTADAVHTLSVVARDQAGNIDATPATRTWTVQTTSPVVTFDISPPEGGYTGAVVLFGWSSVLSPVATAVTYEVSINGGAFNNFGPTATLELNNQPEGPNSVVVRATDNAGLQGTATRLWTVDRTPPTVSLTGAPFPDGAWTSLISPSFIANATDNLPVIPGFEHRFSWTLDTDPPTAFSTAPSLSLQGLAEGLHALSVVAQDGVGNVSVTPASLSWTVDATPPVVAIDTGPAEGEEVGSPDVIFTFSATDNLAPVNQIVFAYQKDGAPFSEFTTDPTATLTGLADGPHSIVVRARDLAGNINNPYLTRNFVVLATPPVIVFESGPTLAIPSASADVTFTWSATSASTLPEQIQYGYALGNAQFTDVGNVTTATIPGLAEGAHVFRVRARDRFNHESVESRDFAVDLTAPTVTIVSGIAEGGWTNATSTTFGFGGADNYSAAGDLTFAWKLDLGPETSFDPATSAVLDPLDEGVHAFSVRGRDPAGNISPTPATRTFTVDRTAPETDIVAGPPPGGTVTTSVVAFTVSGTDDRAAAELLRFSLAVDGGSFSSPAPGVTVTTPTLADGFHSVAIRAHDPAGNADPSPVTRTFTVDAHAPIVTFTSGPAFGACLSADEATFTWEASDQVTPFQNLEYAYRLDGSPPSAFGPTGTVTWPGLAQGPHTIEVQARDQAGLVGIATRNFTVDLTAPVVNAPTARTEDNNVVRFTFTGTDNAGVTGYHIQVDTDPQFPAPLAETDIGAAGDFVLPGTSGNTYYARAQARDCAGNLSPYSAVSNGATINPLPDLTVAAVQAPTTANSGQSIQVSWTVGNNGPGGTQVPAWVDDLYLSPTPVFDPGTATFLGRFDNLSYLAVGETYVNTRTVTLPRGASGPNYLVVATDNLNQMPEANGGNNTAQSAAVQITLSAHADLQVTQVVAPPTAFSGETVEVRWTVTNAGTGRTDVNDWFDTVFLSSDAVLDFTVTPGAIRVNDTPLGTLQRVGAIDPGESYTTSRFVTLPEGINGTYHVFVAADLEAYAAGQPVAQGGRVFEHVAELNFSAPSAVGLLLQPPANLIVDAVTPTGSFNAGEAITVSFDVRNGGFNPSTAPTWSDRVYLSANPSLEGSDVLLGAATHAGGLDLDATYTGQVTGTLPNGISGPYWVIVVADATGQAIESDEADNVRASATSFNVALPFYADLVVTSGSVQATAQANDRIQVSWETTNAGSAATRASSWRDDVWISANPVWSPAGARKLGSVESGSGLAADASYTGTATVQLPLDRTGAQYIHVVADAANAEYEHTAEGNNAAQVGAITVAAYPTIDLVVSGVTASHAPSSGTFFDVTWNVQNQGSGTTLVSTWGEQVYLSADAIYGGDLLLASLSHSGALAGGAGYSRTATVQVPDGISGSFYLIVRSDPGGTSGDNDLADNTAASAAVVPITLTPVPDLVVQGLTVQPGVAGQPLAVEWTIHNQGTGAAVPGQWRTRAYLSLDQYLDAEDLRLEEILHTGGLAGGASYVDVRTPELPVWASGPYYVIVQVDTRGEVYEAAEGNNQALLPVVVSLAEPANLEIIDVQAPAAAVPGDLVTVTWTVRNIGQTAASGVIKNAVFFSPDASFEPTDPLLDLETQTIQLDPGAVMHFSRQMSLARTLQMDAAGNVTGELAGVSPGSYYAIVRGNVIRNIREDDYANNDVVGATPMDVTVTALTLGVPAPTTAAVGRSRYFVVGVPAGQDLRVRVTSDQTAATNELFVAYGRTPTPGDFDFSGPATFTSKPVVTVPTTQAGDYYILVRALAAPPGPPQNLTVQADALPYSLTGITPSRGGQPGVVTTAVSGAGLRPDTRVFLYRGFELLTEAVEVDFVNSTLVRARWNLATVPGGIKVDVVALTGGETATLFHAFTAEPALPPQLTTTSLTPDVIRENATTSFTYRYRNDGNTDMGVLRARLLFPAGSELISLVKDARLLSRSDLLPELHTAGAGDAFVVGDGTAVPLKVVDLQAADLAPGEELSVSLNLRGFPTSPYTVRSLTETMSPSTFLRRELARIEQARQAILANPDGFAADAVAQASSGADFAAAAVENGMRSKGLLSQREIDEHITANGGLVGGSSDAPEGPAALLAEVLAGGPCAPPSDVPDCEVDSAPVPSGQPACATCVDDDLPIGVRLPMPIDLPLPGSACAGFTDTKDATGKVVAPCDPNVITGPAGYGPERWVAGVQTLTYRVDFENLAEIATAPAQVVRVAVPLDPDFDVTTFRLGNLGFGVHTISVPSNRTTFSAEPYFTDLDLNVRITAGIDVINRKAVWTLTSIDPLTGLQPTNPYVGFLPVNDPQGRGQGFVTFTIRASGTVPTGTALQAQGEIIFDTNQPLLTETLQNQVDNEKPVSQVMPNPVVLGDTQVEIAWTGADAPGGAGIASYALYMRADGGAFALQTQNLTASGMTLQLTPGHTYGFYTLAKDNSGNQETGKLNAEATADLPAAPTGAGSEDLPLAFAVYQSFPNPLRDRAAVRFDLPRAAEVTLEVFDVAGRRVLELAREQRYPAGRHRLVVRGADLSTGLFFYRFRAGDYEATRKLLVLR